MIQYKSEPLEEDFIPFDAEYSHPSAITSASLTIVCQSTGSSMTAQTMNILTNYSVFFSRISSITCLTV